MRGLEEQLRRVRSQYFQVKGSKGKSDLDALELLNNARAWFLRTVHNTELVYGDLRMPAIDFLVDESFTKQKNPPYNHMYPSILWIISTLSEEQIASEFGILFNDKFKSIVSQLGFNSTNGSRREREI